MKHDDAIKDNTRALNDLADAIRPIDGAGHHPDKYQPGADESARVLAGALRGLLGALEDATRWARDALARISRDPHEDSGDPHEDQFAEAIARTLRGEK